MDGYSSFPILVEVKDDVSFLSALRKVRRSRFRLLEAYSPYPVTDASSSASAQFRRFAAIILFAAAAGAMAGFFAQYYMSAAAYLIDDAAAWRSFLPIRGEFVIVFAAIAALAALGVSVRLSAVSRTTAAPGAFHISDQDRFFLLIEGNRDAVQQKQIEQLVGSENLIGVYEIPVH